MKTPQMNLNHHQNRIKPRISGGSNITQEDHEKRTSPIEGKCPYTYKLISAYYLMLTCCLPCDVKLFSANPGIPYLLFRRLVHHSTQFPGLIKNSPGLLKTSILCFGFIQGDFTSSDLEGCDTDLNRERIQNAKNLRAYDTI